MERFSYVRAENVPHALALLNEPGLRSRVLAGGTDLLLLARSEPDLCDRVVDISRLPELHRIDGEVRPGSAVTIGAAATFSEVIESPLVQATAPALVQACGQVGAAQVRNMGTLGGNVANAAACADSLPALVCLDAVARVATPEGECEWPVSALVRSPNHTHIPSNGLLVAFRYVVPPAGTTGVFLKLGRRNAMAISRLTVAAMGRLDADGRIAEARLVPGSAAPQFRRFVDTEAVLLGQAPDEPLFEAAATQAVAEMVGLTGKRWSSEFKEPALAAMVVRALRAVFCGSQS